MQHILENAQLRVQRNGWVVAEIGLHEEITYAPRNDAMRFNSVIKAVAMPWRRCASATARS